LHSGEKERGVPSNSYQRRKREFADLLFERRKKGRTTANREVDSSASRREPYLKAIFRIKGRGSIDQVRGGDETIILKERERDRIAISRRKIAR